MVASADPSASALTARTSGVTQNVKPSYKIKEANWSPSRSSVQANKSRSKRKCFVSALSRTARKATVIAS